MAYRNRTIRGIPAAIYQPGGGGAQSQGGWAPATQGPIGPANHHLPKHLAKNMKVKRIFWMPLS